MIIILFLGLICVKNFIYIFIEEYRKIKSKKIIINGLEVTIKVESMISSSQRKKFFWIYSALLSMIILSTPNELLIYTNSGLLDKIIIIFSYLLSIYFIINALYFLYNIIRFKKGIF